MAVGGSVMEPEKNRYRVNDQVKNVFWFSLWIGKFTWLRLKEGRRDRNWEVRWSVKLSGRMLKSSVTINSWGVVAAKDKN